MTPTSPVGVGEEIFNVSKPNGWVLKAEGANQNKLDKM